MRVAFLTHRLPYAPNRGDRIRAYHMLRTLSTYADVDLLSLVHDDEEAAHVEEARGLAASVTTVRVQRARNMLRAGLALAGRRPLTHVLLDAAGIGRSLDRLAERRPDVVFAYCSGMARFIVEGPLSRFPSVVDLVDVDSKKWSDLAERTPPPLRWVYQREASRLGAFEAIAAARASAALIINEREAAIARALAPDANLQVVSNGVDVSGFTSIGPPSENARVVFCGVMDYAPNEDAALWLAREIWPAVRAARPDATLMLMGSNPTARIAAACAPDASIQITGFVPDVRPNLWSSAIAVAPLRVARGLQNKALEALAAGLPTVVTPAVAAGLPKAVSGGCVVAETAAEFASRIVDLLATGAAERRAIAMRADLEQLSWSTTLAPLPAILQSAIGQPRRKLRTASTRS